MVSDDIAMRPARSPRIVDIGASRTEAEAVHPGDLGEQPDDLAEREQGADQENADDECVEARIGEEGGPDLAMQHRRHEAAQDQKHQHPHQEDAGRGELERVDVSRHGVVARPSVKALNRPQ